MPASNCIVRFDPVLNAVSHVQGRGRARQADSSLVVLAERSDRTTSLLQEVEQTQAVVAKAMAENSAQRIEDLGICSPLDSDQRDGI